LTRSHFAGLASLLPQLAFRRTPWLRPRYGHRIPASAHSHLYVVVLLGHLSWRTAPARTARVPLTPPVRAAKSCAYTHACSAPRCPRAPFAACCAHSSTCRARQSRSLTLLLRPPNTCTRHQLPHARSLLPPEPAPPGLARRAALCQRPQPEPPATYPALRRAIVHAPAPAHAPLAPTCAPPASGSPAPKPRSRARAVLRLCPARLRPGLPAPRAAPGPARSARHPPLRRAATVRAPGYQPACRARIQPACAPRVRALRPSARSWARAEPPPLTWSRLLPRAPHLHACMRAASAGLRARAEPPERPRCARCSSPRAPARRPAPSRRAPPTPGPHCRAPPPPLVLPPGAAQTPCTSGGKREGGGKRDFARAAAGGEGIKAPERREQRRRRIRFPQGLMRNFRKLQGPICKAKFPIDLKPE
jgi:hypothetical protein